MFRPRHTAGGWVLMELVIGIIIMGMLLTGLAVAQAATGKYNEFQLVRQRCVAAGQAQVDCIAATGRPLAEADVARLWPGIRVEAQRSPGTGQWAGLTLLEVTATGASHGHPVAIRLSRYLAPGKEG